MLCVVSVVDSVSATSMPVNEFVIYRSIHHFPMRQILIVLDGECPQNVVIPADVSVIYAHGSKSTIRRSVKRILKSCKESGEDVVFHLHHQKAAIAFFTATAFMRIKGKCLYTVHSTYSGRSLKYKLSSCYCVLKAKYANCVSKAAYEEYNAFIRRIKSQRFVAVPNGVDTDRIDAVLAKVGANREKDRKSLVCVGRMIPLKNHAFLIELMQDLPDYELTLIGAEDKEGNTRRMAEELGVADRIRFSGLLPREEVFEALASSGIYLSPSKVEGLPVSVLEAMRAGLVTIVSDILPHQEIQENCPDLCVLPLKKELWIQNIREYAERISAERFRAVCKDISESVKSKYSLEHMHSQYDGIYRKMTQQ